MSTPRSRSSIARTYRPAVAPLEARNLLTATVSAGTVVPLTAAEAYVTQVYQNLLDRAPTAADLARDVPLVNAGPGGIKQVATIVTSSTELRSDELRAAYRSAFGGDLSATDLANFLVQTKGQSVAQVEADILSSSSFYDGPGGGTNASYLRAVDSILIGRDSGPDDATSLAQLAAGASKTSVIDKLIASEGAADRVVDQAYGQTLLRAPDASGLGNASALIEKGYPVEGLDALLVTSPEYIKAAEAATNDIITTATDLGEFKILTTDLGTAGLLSPLESAGPYTLFATTDTALAALPANTSLWLEIHPLDMARIFEHQIVAGEVPASQIMTPGTVTAFDGLPLTTGHSAYGDPQIGGATLVLTNVRASNGIIHAIDAVLSPTGP